MLEGRGLPYETAELCVDFVLFFDSGADGWGGGILKGKTGWGMIERPVCEVDV